MLKDKSITELRTIAQGLGVSDIFSKSQPQLVQAIEQKHDELIPQPKINVPVEYKTIPTGNIMDKQELTDLLRPYINRGLKVAFTDETWKFSFGRKNDSGTMRMPYKIVIKKAAEVLA